mmetsp:Transcript_25496/g.71330  ORF Transcript_25496/g.71330 Transcript_25496/m.71330 type:complete len:106 (+) Transcript_25496:1930-2247(+)
MNCSARRAASAAASAVLEDLDVSELIADGSGMDGGAAVAGGAADAAPTPTRLARVFFFFLTPTDGPETAAKVIPAPAGIAPGCADEIAPPARNENPLELALAAGD